MSNLKDRLIRLGSQEPELQKHLRPVLDKVSWGSPSSFSDFDRILDVSTSTYLEKYKYFDETGRGSFMPVRKDNPLDVGDIAHVCIEEERSMYSTMSAETANVEVLGVSMKSPPDHAYWKHGNIPYYDLKVLDTGEEITRCSVDMQMSNPYTRTGEVSINESSDYVTEKLERALKSEGIRTKRRRSGTIGSRTIVPEEVKGKYPPKYPYTSDKVKKVMKSKLGLNFGFASHILLVKGPLEESWKYFKLTWFDKEAGHKGEEFDEPRWSSISVSSQMVPIGLT